MAKTVFLAYNLRRAVSILGVSTLIERVKAAFLDILALRHRRKRQNRSLGLKNFSVVWRCRVAQRVSAAA